MLKLGDELEAQGHEVEYFGMYDAKNTVGNSLGVYTTNMDFHSTGAERFLYPFRIIFSAEAKKKIGMVLDAFRPDVVHMNNINFQLTPSIIYAVKERNIPLVQTVHDYQMICPNHLLYSFTETRPCDRCITGSKLNCARHKCIHNSFVKSLLGVVEAKVYAALKTYRKVDLYICPSRFLENKLLSASGLYAGKTFTVHNFIEKKPVPEGVGGEEPYIAFVGRLSREKGVSLLAETAKLLPNCRFLVAGTGPDDACLKDIPNVILKGFLTGEELTRFMAGAKALILPSVCYENCPLSILESHSFGVPVITMNSGGMAELVEDGKTGTLVSTPTPEALADAVKACMEDATYYNTLKANCEAVRGTILGAGEYCDILLRKYRELIGKR